MNGSGGRYWRGAVSAAVSASLWLVMSSPAAAQETGGDAFDCAAPVVDEAGVLDTDAVTSEALSVG